MMAAHLDFAALRREVRSATAAAGIDAAEQQAVRQWLRDPAQHGSAPTRQTGYPPADRPSALPPVRLPAESKLADQARQSRRLWELYRLRDWVARRRPVLTGGLLEPRDAVALVREFRIRPEEASERGSVDGGDPAIRRLWRTAVAAGFITGGPEPPQPVELDESDTGLLRRWLSAFACGSEFKEYSGQTEPQVQEGYRAAEKVLGVLLHDLYLQRGPLEVAGVVTRLLRDLLSEAVAEEVITREQQTAVRVRAFAATRFALARLMGHGALKRGTYGEYELTSLGLWGMNRVLADSGFVTPVLGAYSGADAATLLVALAGYFESERAEEFDGWCAVRGEAKAAAELLSLAAIMDSGDRGLAMTLLRRLNPDAEAAVRDGLRDRRVGPHCRAWLAARGMNLDRELTDADRACILVEEIQAGAREDSPEEFVRNLERVMGSTEYALLPAMARLDHPAAPDSLRLLFEFHSDPDVTAVSGWLLRGGIA